MASSSRLARLPLPSISLRDKASAYDSCAALAAHLMAHMLSPQEYESARDCIGGVWPDAMAHIGSCIEHLGLFLSERSEMALDKLRNESTFLCLRKFLNMYKDEDSIIRQRDRGNTDYHDLPYSFDYITHSAIFSHLDRAKTHEELVTLLVLMPSEQVYPLITTLEIRREKRNYRWDVFFQEEEKERDIVNGKACRHFGSKYPNAPLYCFVWVLKQSDCPEYLLRLPLEILRILVEFIKVENCQVPNCEYVRRQKTRKVKKTKTV